MPLLMRIRIRCLVDFGKSDEMYNKKVVNLKKYVIKNSYWLCFKLKLILILISVKQGLYLKYVFFSYCLKGRAGPTDVSTPVYK